MPALSSSSWQSLASPSQPPANYESPGQSSHWNHSIWLLSHCFLSGFRFTCIHLIELKCRESCSTICLMVNNCKNPAFHFEMGHCMVEWSAAASVSSVGACSFWEQPQAHLLVFAMNLSDEEDTACASEAWYAIYIYIYAYIISFNMCIYKHKTVEHTQHNFITYIIILYFLHL